MVILTKTFRLSINIRFIIWCIITLLISCGKKTSTNPADQHDNQILSCKINSLGDLDFSEDVSSQYIKNSERNGKIYNLIWCRGDTKLNNKTIYLVFELWSTANLNNNTQFNIGNISINNNGFCLHLNYHLDNVITYVLKSGTLKLESFNATTKTATGVFTGNGHTNTNQSFTLTNGKFSLNNFQIIEY